MALCRFGMGICIHFLLSGVTFKFLKQIKHATEYTYRRKAHRQGQIKNVLEGNLVSFCHHGI